MLYFNLINYLSWFILFSNCKEMNLQKTFNILKRYYKSTKLYLVILKGLENVSEFLNPCVNWGQEFLNLTWVRHQVRRFVAVQFAHLFFYQSEAKEKIILRLTLRSLTHFTKQTWNNHRIKAQWMVLYFDNKRTFVDWRGSPVSCCWWPFVGAGNWWSRRTCTWTSSTTSSSCQS